ncbi:MAG TPA: hypothetical protein VK211_10730 [Kamptonema sp.]|nr:hypothetical protein [Kamptonema sp.]
MANIKETNEPDANLDPISGEPGAHPVGTGIGAGAAGAAGAAIGGVLGGPVGAVVGAAVGAVAGGLVGKGTAESFNPTEEEAYWQENYSTRPYAEAGVAYDNYEPAYRTGYEGYTRYGTAGRSFDEIESDLQNHYETNRGQSNLSWEKAKYAARDAWDKVERKLPGDLDRDGR